MLLGSGEAEIVNFWNDLIKLVHYVANYIMKKYFLKVRSREYFGLKATTGPSHHPKSNWSNIAVTKLNPTLKLRFSSVRVFVR
jgi:hypothetical protein